MRQNRWTIIHLLLALYAICLCLSSNINAQQVSTTGFRSAFWAMYLQAPYIEKNENYRKEICKVFEAAINSINEIHTKSVLCDPIPAEVGNDINSLNKSFISESKDLIEQTGSTCPRQGWEPTNAEIIILKQKNNIANRIDIEFEVYWSHDGSIEPIGEIKCADACRLTNIELTFSNRECYPIRSIAEWPKDVQLAIKPLTDQLVRINQNRVRLKSAGTTSAAHSTPLSLASGMPPLGSASAPPGSSAGLADRPIQAPAEKTAVPQNLPGQLLGKPDTSRGNPILASPLPTMPSQIPLHAHNHPLGYKFSLGALWATGFAFTAVGGLLWGLNNVPGFGIKTPNGQTIGDCLKNNSNSVPGMPSQGCADNQLATAALITNVLAIPLLTLAIPATFFYVREKSGHGNR